MSFKMIDNKPITWGSSFNVNWMRGIIIYDNFHLFVATDDCFHTSLSLIHSK